MSPGRVPPGPLLAESAWEEFPSAKIRFVRPSAWHRVVRPDGTVVLKETATNPVHLLIATPFVNLNMNDCRMRSGNETVAHLTNTWRFGNGQFGGNNGIWGEDSEALTLDGENDRPMKLKAPLADCDWPIGTTLDCFQLWAMRGPKAYGPLTSGLFLYAYWRQPGGWNPPSLTKQLESLSAY